jgi:hypothetical protein
MYSLAAALIIFLIGLAVASILFFGREYPVLEADLEENENRYNGGLDNTTDSSASAAMILIAAKPRTMGCTWLSLRVVLQGAGLLHVFAFIWACIGVFWHYIFPVMQCDVEIKQVRNYHVLFLKV